MFRLLRNTAAGSIMSMLFSLLIWQSAIAGPDGDAKKAYERGDFESAVRILVEKLRKKPDHQDNITMMETSLPFALKKLQGRAETAEAMSNWDEANAAYVYLQKFCETVSNTPPVIREVKKDGKKVKEPTVFEVPNVTPKIAETRDKAITTHYQKGLDYEQSQAWKSAAVEFRLVRGYDPSYQDAATRYTDCRKKAMIRICVMPFENVSGKTEFGDLGTQLTDQIRSKAMNSQPEFLEFVDRAYLNQLLAEQGIQQSTVVDENTATTLGKKVGVQAFIFGKVLSVVPNFPADIVKHGSNSVQVYKDKQTITLQAQYDIHQREASVAVGASFQAIEVEKGTVLASETVSEDAKFLCKWVLYSGSQEAIPSEVLKDQTDGGEKAAPSREVLVQDAMNKLSGRLASALASKFQ